MLNLGSYKCCDTPWCNPQFTTLDCVCTVCVKDKEITSGRTTPKKYINTFLTVIPRSYFFYYYQSCALYNC